MSRTRTEWLDLLHRCQDGHASCAFVASAIEDELSVLVAEIDRRDVEAARHSMCVMVPLEDHDREQAELATLRAEVARLENLTATGIHSCHDQCARPMCVLRQERDAAVAEAKRWESLCTIAWQRHDEVSARLWDANLELAASRASAFVASPPISSNPEDSHGMWPVSTPSP